MTIRKPRMPRIFIDAFDAAKSNPEQDFL